MPTTITAGRGWEGGVYLGECFQQPRDVQDDFRSRILTCTFYGSNPALQSGKWWSLTSNAAGRLLSNSLGLGFAGALDRSARLNPFLLVYASLDVELEMRVDALAWRRDSNWQPRKQTQSNQIFSDSCSNIKGPSYLRYTDTLELTYPDISIPDTMLTRSRISPSYL